MPGELTAPPSAQHEVDCYVILVGSWPAMPVGRFQRSGGMGVYRCTDRDELASAVHTRRAEWILAGQELDDGDIQHTISGVRAVRESVRLAVLGQRRDWRRCDRWMRRGCQVYLEETISLRRASAALRAARNLEVNVMDRVFSDALRERATGPAPHLTRRERDVLELLTRGLRNREIASALFVTENTVEYHMRHLLSKFSARNRVEVVERATVFGLA
jgi:DNA-binding NarL/FixJ family response regulator